MKIIPAIDIKDGMCVRLFKGDFEKTTEYSTNPAEIGQRFSTLAVDDLHIVDLDGARTGTQQNHSIVSEIIAQSGLSVQLGGGIRESDDVVRWLEAGVARCVVGSAAIKKPETVQQWLREFGTDAIVLALDIKLNESRVPMLTTQGWTEDSGLSLWDCIDNYHDVGVRHVLCTDVARDGTMAGPNFKLYSDILARYPRLTLQASGGVRSIEDLHKLRGHGIPAAITGRALLDRKISAKEVASFRQSA
jgi:phosphoribosylformimino-5-aminoimidazole carboxamide ribotide isomerase